MTAPPTTSWASSPTTSPHPSRPSSSKTTSSWAPSLTTSPPPSKLSSSTTTSSRVPSPPKSPASPPSTTPPHRRQPMSLSPSMSLSLSFVVAVLDDVVPAHNCLLDPSNSSLRHQSLAAISFLSTASDASCKAVFDDDAIVPLIRALENGSVAMRESVVIVIEVITLRQCLGRLRLQWSGGAVSLLCR